MNRCAWVPMADPLYVAYHDEEWGVPERDERKLFELLNLEGAQAGLSWSTILHKREGYRSAFAGWDLEAVARFGERDVERLVGDPGIVRHRGKIEAVIGNARTALGLDVPLSELLWSFVDGEPRVNAWRTIGGDPGRDGGVEGDEQGAQATRLPLHRPDHLLRLHAVRRPRGRPRARLLQAAGAVTKGSRSSSVRTADVGSWSATQIASASARASAFASHAS